VKESRACVVHCVAAGGPDVLAAIFAGMDDSGPKVPVECTKVLTECIVAFGAFSFNVKEVCGKLVSQLDKPDKSVKEASQKLLFELCKWLGQPCLEFLINKLKDKEKEELLKKLADGGDAVKPSAMKPKRELKIKGPEVKYEFDKDQNLVLDMVEAVDMNELLKSKELADWKTKVTAEKWNEKVEGMVMIVKACGSPPKLMDKDYSEVIDVLKELCKDKMIAVAIAAFNTMGVVADGMGANFAKYTKNFVPIMMPRMKDAKLVSPTQVAFGKMYGRSLAIKDVFNGVQEFVIPSKPENKMPPHTSVGGVALLADFVSKDKVGLSKDEWGDLGTFSFTIIQKVSDPKVKKANFELMVNLLAREKKEGKDAVKKLVAPLAESKAAADKKMFKQLWAAADPEAAAAEEAARKAAEEEKTKAAEEKKAAGKKKKDTAGDAKPKKKKKKGPSEEELAAKAEEERLAKEAEEAAKGGPPLVMTEEEAVELLKLCFTEAEGSSAASDGDASGAGGAPPPPPPHPLAPAGGVLWKVAKKAKVYDRAGSKGATQQIATLEKGQMCVVLKTEGNWHHIQNVWPPLPKPSSSDEASGKGDGKEEGKETKKEGVKEVAKETANVDGGIGDKLEGREDKKEDAKESADAVVRKEDKEGEKNGTKEGGAAEGVQGKEGGKESGDKLSKEGENKETAKEGCPVAGTKESGEAWFQFQSEEGKPPVAEVAPDLAAAEAEWTKQQVEYLASLQAASAAAAPTNEPSAAAVAGGEAPGQPGAQAQPGEPPGAQASTPAAAEGAPNESAPAEPLPPSRPPQKPAGGGAFWMLLKSKKVYDKATSKESTEIVVLKGLQMVYVLKSEGNWHQIQNVWANPSSGAPVIECWYQFTDKKGSKFSELASDPADAEVSWTKAQEAFIAKEDAAPPAPAAVAPGAGAGAGGAHVGGADATSGAVDGAVAVSGDGAPLGDVGSIEDTPPEEERVVPVFSKLLKDLNGSDVKAKAKACEALGWGHFKGKVASRSAAAVTLMRVKCGNGDWKKENNVNVLKGCFLGVQALARQSRRAGGAAEALKAQQERNARLAFLKEQQEIFVEEEVSVCLSCILLSKVQIVCLSTLSSGILINDQLLKALLSVYCVCTPPASNFYKILH